LLFTELKTQNNEIDSVGL